MLSVIPVNVSPLKEAVDKVKPASVLPAVIVTIRVSPTLYVPLATETVLIVGLFASILSVFRVTAVFAVLVLPAVSVKTKLVVTSFPSATSVLPSTTVYVAV